MITRRNHNQKVTYFSPLTWVMGRWKVPQPHCRLICPSWPSSGSCSLSPSGQFHQGDTDVVPSSWAGEQGCSAIWEMAAWTPCRALFANLRDRSSPANHCPCLLTHQRENTKKKRCIYLKSGTSPPTGIQTVHTHSTFQSETFQPQTLRFRNKLSKIFTKQMLCYFAKEKGLASGRGDTTWAVGQQGMRLSDLARFCSRSLLFSAFKNFPSVLTHLLSISKRAYPQLSVNPTLSV